MMKFNKIIAASIAGLMMLTMSACSSEQAADTASEPVNNSEIKDKAKDIAGSLWDKAKNKIHESTDDNDNTQQVPSEPNLNGAQAVGNYTATTWDASTEPDYYQIAGQAVQEALDTTPSTPGVNYTGLDSLGRPGRASALINKKMRDEGSERKRADLPDPAGYTGNNKRVEIQSTHAGDKAYHGYFYNRSHMIAKSLGGKDELENLVNGTRMQNVGMNDSSNPGGMAYTETIARDWLDKNPDGTIQYVATPVYEGNEIMPRSVFVDIKTSDGSINQHVEVFNTAYGYTIDYSTGKFNASN